MEKENKSVFPKDVEVLILGGYHFDPPGTDLVNLEVEDILSPRKQSEICEVVDKLEKFKPTKIAVEIPFSSREKFNKDYEEYCLNNKTLARHEAQQIGFRLASILNHPKVYPINEKLSLPFDTAMEYASEHCYEFQEDFVKRATLMDKELNELQKNGTVLEVLKYFNRRSWIKNNHSLYVDTCFIGAGHTYYGAEILYKWYERNIRIFANLQHIAEDGDRILVIYGGGHAAILRELVSGSSNMKLIDPLLYL